VVTARARCAWCNRNFDSTVAGEHGVYCSTECHSESVLHLLRRERHSIARHDSFLRAAERFRLENEAARLRSARRAAESKGKHAHCPKCSAEWCCSAVSGAPARHRGECSHCGFAAEFVAIEQCPHCEDHSLLIVSADTARCPRCKSQPRRQRQVA
jgi:hypothetical protein